MEFPNLRIVLTPHDPYDHCVPLSKTLKVFGSKSINTSAVLGGRSHFTSKTANSRVQTLISSVLKYRGGIRKDSKCNEARPNLGVEDPMRVIEIGVNCEDYKLYM